MSDEYIEQRYECRVNSCSHGMQTFNPVIYAWGTTDTVDYHMTRRGSQAVNFVQGDKGPPLPPEAKTFQLHVNNVSIIIICISYNTSLRDVADL